LSDRLLAGWSENDVLTLTINRPEQRNAVDPELLSELSSALSEHGDRAGAVILRGSGDEAFCAGYDLARLTGTAADLEADGYIGEAVAAIGGCPAPVIARLAGHCHGAGVELALTCDLRVASPSLRMSVPAVSLGVVYRYEFIARLVAMAGAARASSLLLGMQTLNLEDASAWGFVNFSAAESELDGKVRDLARKLATSPRAAVRGTKASLNLLLARAIDQADFEVAQRLRAEAASSPERKQALDRRRKR
jgi:enoyl-CoA hydratase/carnithine racemase